MMMRSLRAFNNKFASPHSAYIRRLTNKINIAILIDGDNANPKLFSKYIEEATKHGKPTVRRCYGDWSERGLGGWKDDLNSFAIRPIQKFSYTTKKNSTDTALIIDAMDLLHSEKVQGFCIVSSDSDYTGLALRIREEGYFVMGIGEAHTARAFINACEVFTCTDELEDTKLRSRQLAKPSSINDQLLMTMVLRIFDEAVVHEKSGRIRLSVVGDILMKKLSSFDIRQYGHSSLSSFCQQSLPSSHRIVLVGGTAFLETVAGASTVVPRKDEVTGFVSASHLPPTAADVNPIAMVSAIFGPRSQLEMGNVCQLLMKTYPSFSVKNYGCSTFSQFCQLLLPTFRAGYNPLKPGHVFLERVDENGRESENEMVNLPSNYDWLKGAQLDTTVDAANVQVLLALVLKIFDEEVVKEKSGLVSLDVLGGRLRNLHSNIRRYGYSDWTRFFLQFLPTSHGLVLSNGVKCLRRGGASAYYDEVTDPFSAPLPTVEEKQKQLFLMVHRVFRVFAGTSGRLELGHFCLLFERNYPSFSVKNYGCSNFSELCQLYLPTSFTVVCDANGSMYIERVDLTNVGAAGVGDGECSVAADVGECGRERENEIVHLPSSYDWRVGAQLETTVDQANVQLLLTLVLKIFDEEVVKEKSGLVSLDMLGGRLSAKLLHFNIRRYGYSNLTRFFLQFLPTSHGLVISKGVKCLRKKGTSALGPYYDEVTDPFSAPLSTVYEEKQKQILIMVHNVFKTFAGTSGRLEYEHFCLLFERNYPSFSVKKFSDFSELCQLYIPTALKVVCDADGSMYIERVKQVDLTNVGAAGVGDGECSAAADAADAADVGEYGRERESEMVHLPSSYDWRVGAQLDTTVDAANVQLLLTLLLKIFDEEVVKEKSGLVSFSMLGGRLNEILLHFNIRRYGYASLGNFCRQFLHASHRIVIMGDTASMERRVGASAPIQRPHEVSESVSAQPPKAADAEKHIYSMAHKVFKTFAGTSGRLELGHFCLLLERNYSSFSVKNYGCSNFSELCQLYLPAAFKVVCDADGSVHIERVDFAYVGATGVIGEDGAADIDVCSVREIGNAY